MTSVLTPRQLEQIKLQVTRQMCLDDHLFFTRYFFKLREQISFRVNWHHHLIAEELQKVLDCQTKQLLINVPPGSSKTEMAVVNFVARGLAINPRSRFLHLSYSDDLTGLNSGTAKEIVTSAEYQAMWPLSIKEDSRAKKRWNIVIRGVDEGGVDIYRSAGGVYAVSLNGQVTGFRAGHMVDGFQGAIIVDDPLKPEDAYSKLKRDIANRKLISTVKSRKANPKTPIIVIMQRLAEEDPSGFILKGQFPGKWRHIKIPSLIDDRYVKEHIPVKYHHLVDSTERDEHGRFSYWPYKEPLHELLALEEKQRYVFAGQYQQEPSPLGGALIQGAWFGRYNTIPPIKARWIFADTAQKTKEHNDYSVFEHWGEGEDGRAYLLDVLRGKWEAPDLKRQARAFWLKCKTWNTINQRGSLRSMDVEDKASGTGLIQELKSEPPFIPVKAIERNKDKLTRWMDMIPHIESGYVMIPDEAPWLSDFLGECESLTAEMTHAHDDQVDPMCDAVEKIVGKNNLINMYERLGA